MHGHHLAAHGGFLDLAAFVGGVALAHGTTEGSWNEFALSSFPSRRRIRRRRPTTACRRNQTRQREVKMQNGIEKFIRDGKECFALGNVHLSTITCIAGKTRNHVLGQAGHQSGDRAGSPA